MNRPSWPRITAAIVTASALGAASIWWLGTGAWSLLLAVLTAITACLHVLGCLPFLHRRRLLP